MAGRLMDEDPELAYAHAQAAVRRAGRVDVVREAAGITAYRTGRFAEALRELRTVRRLNGSDEHLAVMADCERGLGRPERAVAIAQDEKVRDLPAALQVELAIVLSGARLDLGEPEAAVAALRTPVVSGATGEQRSRAASALADALEATGDVQGAASLRSALPGEAGPAEDVVVYDLELDGEETDDGEETVGESETPAEPDPGGPGDPTPGSGDRTSHDGVDRASQGSITSAPGDQVGENR